MKKYFFDERVYKELIRIEKIRFTANISSIITALRQNGYIYSFEGADGIIYSGLTVKGMWILFVYRKFGINNHYGSLRPINEH